MLNAYGPDHRRLRGLIAGTFTARRIAALRPRIEAIVGGLLDELAALPADRPVDVRERYAAQVPIKVICELEGQRVPRLDPRRVLGHAEGPHPAGHIDDDGVR